MRATVPLCLTCPRISPRGFILVLTWMKAVPMLRCCSSSVLMSFKTPWALRRRKKIREFKSLNVHSHICHTADHDLPWNHRSLSEASCGQRCCHQFLRSRPAHADARLQWGRRLCSDPQWWSHNVGDTGCLPKPRHGLRHLSALVEIRTGQLKELAALKEEAEEGGQRLDFKGNFKGTKDDKVCVVAVLTTTWEKRQKQFHPVS